MADNRSMASSLSASSSSLHMPTGGAGYSSGNFVPGPQHQRHSSQPKPTASQAYVNSLRASPYATYGPTKAKRPRSSRDMSRAPPRPGFPVRVDETHSQARGLTMSAVATNSRSLSASGRTDGQQQQRRVASHKSREDLLDEVAGMRKAGRVNEHERNLLTGRVRHLEEELLKKDKRIASFLESGYMERNEAVRTRGAGTSKAENITLLMVLKRKVHALETTLRQKDSEVGQLKMDLKTTSLDELQIKVDTYYEEVLRLRYVLAEHESERRDQSQAEQSAEQVQTLSMSLRRVAERNEELRAENQRLVKEVRRAEVATATATPTAGLTSSLRRQSTTLEATNHKSTHTEKRLKSIADRFADSSRQEMVGHVSQVETKNEELTRTLQQAHQEHLATLNELKVLKQRKQDSEDGAARTQELEEQCEKLHSIVKRLKDDRTHYHKLAEERKQLSKHQANKITELGKREKKLASTLQLSEDQLAMEEKARQHARNVQRRKAKMDTVFGEERSAKQGSAAVAIQRQWRSHKSKVRQEKFRADTERAVTEIQGALRAQLARGQCLGAGRAMTSSDDDEEDDVDVA